MERKEIAVTVDMVNKPPHYNAGKFEVIDMLESVVMSMPLSQIEAMLTSQVLKYMCRWKNKAGVQDLEKARWYLNRLIENGGINT